MYTAELFAMANDPKAVKEVFLNNVTLSIEDDAPGCIDLDAEKERLSTIWDLAHLPMRELVARTGLSQNDYILDPAGYRGISDSFQAYRSGYCTGKCQGIM